MNKYKIMNRLMALILPIILFSGCGGGSGGDNDVDDPAPSEPVPSEPIPIEPILEQVTVTGKLNDTGISLCGDYAFDSGLNHNNDVSCALSFDSDGDPLPEDQDALNGRDANSETNNDSDGNKGFNFTKIDSEGFALADQTSTVFSCVKDNVTGFIWEVKQDAVGLHNKDDLYSWLNTDASTNGGDNGSANSVSQTCEGVTNNTCNTQAYAARVNIAGLCGATDWSLPNQFQLGSLMDYSQTAPAIDTVFFPNTGVATTYWTSTTLGSITTHAKYFNSSNGKDNIQGKSDPRSVRLIRSGE